MTASHERALEITFLESVAHAYAFTSAREAG
jgi:hypothetical protein